jgi:ComF family protein
MVYDWLKKAQMLAYPATCILCGAPGEGDRDLCDGCHQDLPHNHHPCRRCALPLPDAAPPHALCGECLKQPPPFDGCRAALRYESPVNHLISGLKFHGRLSYGRLLAELLGSYLEQGIGGLPQLLIPVPLHPSRLRERGFNQALELAHPLGRRFNIPVDIKSCIRCRATEPQSGLDRKDRRRNIRGAFEIAAEIGADHVVLVDDVVTTGNTVNELARLLHRQGVEQIEVWAVARRAADK